MNSFRLKSYFTFLSRNKLYAAINLFGFAVSLAVVILLGLYIKGETSVDKFHKDYDRIFRLKADNWSMISTFPGPLVHDLKARYPEIEELVPVMFGGVRVDHQNQPISAVALYTDPSFFRVFSFPFAEGAPAGQLETRNEALISGSLAATLFGDKSAIGETVVSDNVTYSITGVVEDFSHTHLDYPDIILRLENLPASMYDNYSASQFFFYIKQAPGSDLPAKLPDMTAFVDDVYRAHQSGEIETLHLMPLTKSYFDVGSSPDWGLRGNDLLFIRILLVAMIVILLFAVINYVNLSVAQSSMRAKEAATRRLLGSTRGALFSEFITESVIFCLCAFLCALVLADLAEPLFNGLFRSSIPVRVSGLLGWREMLISLAGVVGLGTFSGLVPAWVISRYRPIEVVQGTFARKTKSVYSRIFICFQYLVTIVLLGCALTIMKQTHFMRNSDPGFDRENVVFINHQIPGTQTEAFRDKLMAIPGVKQVAFSRGGTPVMAQYHMSTNTPEIDGSFEYYEFWMDSLGMSLLGIGLAWETGVHSPEAIWINETAARVLGVGKETLTANEKPLAGVVKDFHFQDFSQQIGSIMIRKLPEKTDISNVVIKIAGPDPGGTYRGVEAACRKFFGGEQPSIGFMDTAVRNWYERQQRTYTIIGSFAVIAILISALGMLAMATYYLRQRTAEIAIRKVFGSTDGEVLYRVITNFMRMVFVAFIIAVPVIWYAMDKWLSSYAYRIPLGWTIFTLAGLTAFAVALSAVYWQSRKATRANPVDSLHR